MLLSEKMLILLIVALTSLNYRNEIFKIKFKRFTFYPINIGYSFDLEVINNVLTTKDKAEIYTMWVATR